MGLKEKVFKSKEEFKTYFECDDIGWMNEYIGCKIDADREKRNLKITQPVLLQSFSGEFDLPKKQFNTPAEPKTALKHSKEEELLGDADQTKYRSGVGKLIHLIR